MRIRSMSHTAAPSTPKPHAALRARRLVLPTMVSVIALTASLEARADSFIAASDEAFDYSGTVNGVAIPGFTSTPGTTVYPGPDAAILSRLHAPAIYTANGTTNYTDFQPNLWAGPAGQNNFGGPSNTNTGFVSLLDPANSNITSETGTWNATHTVFTMNITGTTPNDPSDLNFSNRVWSPTDGSVSPDQSGYYSNYNLTLSATFAAGAVTEQNPFFDWWSTSAAPTSVTGTFNGIFNNTGGTAPGVYNVALNFNNMNWAANNGVPDNFTGIAPYFGASDCPSPTASCSVTYGTTGTSGTPTGQLITVNNSVSGPNALQVASGGDGFDGYDGGFVNGGNGGDGTSNLTIGNVTSAISTGAGGNGGIGFTSGGNGGKGTATINLTNATTGMVGAFGGNGGWGVSSSASTGTGGNGGDADASGTMTNVSNGTFLATAGNGAEYFQGSLTPIAGTGGNGGNATVTGSISGDVTGTFTANGGNGGDNFSLGNGGNGGTNTVNSTLVTGLLATDPATNISLAQGGNGGQGTGTGFAGGTGGAGVIAGPIEGVSVSKVPGVTGSGTVTVNATQIGGSGGNGASNASGGTGAASTLISNITDHVLNAGVEVDGWTTGTLNLNLAATGGDGGGADGTGTAQAGTNGTATLINDQTGLPVNAQAAVLNGTATGTGGNGGFGTSGAAGANGGVGMATANIFGNNAVSATANIIGGNGGDVIGGGNAGDGASETNGIATLAFAASNGTGPASATTTAVGGNGGTSFDAANGGNGGNATLIGATAANVVGPGTASLTQLATGGNGGGSTGGTAGLGGDATSLLADADGTASVLNVTLGATGGNGGAGLGGGSDGNSGGHALVGGLIQGTGAVNVTANMTAGNGGDATGLGTSGADGTALSYSNPLSPALGLITGVSTSGPVSVIETGTAGNGGNGTNGAFAGNGGDATLRNTVTGTTVGSTLTLSQTATAGNGGNADTQNGGTGGNAISDLTQISLLSTTFTGTSTANGGNGGTSSGANNGAGGGAVANINLTGGNAVFATANANGGSGSSGGAANALAIGTGTSGLASANASTPGTGPVFAVNAHANGTIGSTTIANANTNIGGSVPQVTVGNPSGLMPAFAPGFAPNSFAFATGLPSAASVTAALAGPPAHPINTPVWTQPTAFVAGAGLQGAAFNGTLGTPHTYQTETDYNFNVPFGKGTLLTVGLLNDNSFGTFTVGDSLTFTITDNLATIFTQTFTSLAAADAFFSDDVLTFGNLIGNNTIGIELDLTALDNVGFQSNFLVGTSGPAGGPAGVPEPGTFAIFFSALLGWFGIRLHRSKSETGAKMA